MTWLDDAGSVEDSDFREGYQFDFPSVVYRLARGDEDVVIDGATYRASPIGRSDVAVSTVTGQEELTIQLPLDHDVAQRYINHGIPPMFLRVTIKIHQARSNTARVAWAGNVISGSIDGSILNMLVPSRLGEAVGRPVSNLTAGRTCPHILYGPDCKASMTSANLQNRTVAAVDGPFVTVGGGALPPVPWTAVHGMVIHPASGERRTVRAQAGQDLTMQYAIPGMQIGDAIQVTRGCDHTIGTCQTAFANQGNFGGAPNMPSRNPFLPGKNLGVIQS